MVLVGFFEMHVWKGPPTPPNQRETNHEENKEVRKQRKPRNTTYGK